LFAVINNIVQVLFSYAITICHLGLIQNFLDENEVYYQNETLVYKLINFNELPGWHAGHQQQWGGKD
jgi:hypothetical protein